MAFFHIERRETKRKRKKMIECYRHPSQFSTPRLAFTRWSKELVGNSMCPNAKSKCIGCILIITHNSFQFNSVFSLNVSFVTFHCKYIRGQMENLVYILIIRACVTHCVCINMSDKRDPQWNSHFARHWRWWRWKLYELKVLKRISCVILGKSLKERLALLGRIFLFLFIFYR